MKIKTVLITGGLGFIGTNIIRHLLVTTDYNILVLDKATYAGRPENLPDDRETQRRVRFVKGDITKRRIVEHCIKQSTMVLHLAADTHAGRSLSRAFPTVMTNVIGTTILLESIEKFPVERFILFSSSEVYGNQAPGVSMNENHPLNPVSPYAASKLAADRLAYSFYLTKKLPVTVLRPFNAYGPYQHPEKMIPLFITRLLKDQPVFLNHGGKQSRDWVYVQDHCRAVELVMKASPRKVKGEIFNIGTGEATTIREIAEMILKALRKDQSYLRIVSSSLPETMGNIGISDKARNVLGWKPLVSLEEGIQKTVHWYQKNRKWWDR